MYLIIANNLNVHSFSLKPGTFCKEPFWSENGLFKKNLLYLNKGKRKSKYVKTKNLNLIKLHFFVF